GVRLTGVAASSFSDDPGDELFLDVDLARRERLAVTTQALRERFGTTGLTRASLLPD
ncbi:MAG: DNA polymerase IV, partial [Deltaproteobacteria bacterium]|nr:DNA polymerase IV [Deltaproteobacteria bacterium]